MNAHSCESCTVQSTFCPFPVRNAFEHLKTTSRYERGETVFHEADPCQTVFVLCEGRVKLVTGSSEGRILLLAFVEPGQILGLAEAVLGGAPYECSAIAVEPATMAAIPRETFIRFVNTNPQAGCRVTLALSAQYKKAQREEKSLGLGETSMVRLAHLLIDWSEERGLASGDGVRIPLHVTHTDLANAIGATRETVTRILSDLSRRGIVDRTAHEIVIRSPAELSRLAS